MLDNIITYSFYLLFFLTPFFWTSLNYELFEYNKMLLTYGLTVVIVGAWLLKIINRKSLIFNRTPLDIPLLLFLAANIVSTVFSMDVHTSIWGYYSRLNGGLLSTVSYLLLYWAFVSNMDPGRVKNILRIGLVSGFLISLWAIAEHFGASLSCLILRGELNTSCWIQDVQARVFATLGQPNWLAAYLSMLIFPAMYFLLTAKNKFSIFIFQFSIIVIYLAFTFTYSRGPTLGLIGGTVIFLTMSILSSPRRRGSNFGLNLFKWIPAFAGMTKQILIVLTSFLIINLLFGSALTSFRLVSRFAAPTRPTISLPTASSGTQLETGGTESGQIRLIVWQGALEIFKHYPIFGSGLETFAYSYYQYRPRPHNLTTEWDFLYNKAHNEYLNYLATTGIVGLGSYSIIIITFIIFILKKHRSKNLLSYSLLAAYVSYLVYNFFLFSVVIIAIFFYLFPALVFVDTGSTKPLKLPSILHSTFYILHSIYRRSLYTTIAKGMVIFATVYLLFSIFQIWYADTLFAKSQTLSETGKVIGVYDLLSVASDLNKSEPFYKSELGFTAAQASVSEDSDATLSGQLKDEAILQTAEVLKWSPQNISYLRTAVRTYFELATFDKNYLVKTLQTLDLAIKLAPTDPKLYYNKALILNTMGKKDEEVKALQEAINLKPNYLEALAQLKEATGSGKAR